MNGVVRRRYYVSKEKPHWRGSMTLGNAGASTNNILRTVLTRDTLKPGHTYQIVWSYPHPFGDKAGWSMTKRAALYPTLPENAARNGNIQLVATNQANLSVIASDTHGVPTVLTYDIYDLGVL